VDLQRYPFFLAGFKGCLATARKYKMRGKGKDKRKDGMTWEEKGDETLLT